MSEYVANVIDAPEPVSASGENEASWCAVTCLGDAAQIVEPGVQVCSWQRVESKLWPLAAPRTTPNSAPDTSITSGAFAPTLEVLRAGDRPHLGNLAARPEYTALIDDLAMLGQVLHDLIGCPSVGLRVAGVTGAMCPGWHIDRVSLRLICTYRGPGTQWLDDQRVDRDSLQAPGLARRPGISARAGEVVFLKGSGWPGNEHLGAVHRSPDVPGGQSARIVATLDPLWPA